MSDQEENNVVDINQSQAIKMIRSLGMGQLGSFKDYCKVFASGIHEISEVNGVWNYVNTPNDVVANLHLMISYALETMVSDLNTQESGPTMHDTLPDFTVSEVNLATVVLNILDLGDQHGYRIPEVMVAIYNERLKNTNNDIDVHNSKLADGQSKAPK